MKGASRTHLNELSIITKFNDSSTSIITPNELKAFNTMVDYAVVDYAVELEIEKIMIYMEQDNWISVDDEKPNGSTKDEYLCYFKYLDGEKNKGDYIQIEHVSEYTPISMYEGFKPLGSHYGFRKLTHWQPLPKSPK